MAKRKKAIQAKEQMTFMVEVQVDEEVDAVFVADHMIKKLYPHVRRVKMINHLYDTIKPIKVVEEFGVRRRWGAYDYENLYPQKKVKRLFDDGKF